MALAVRKQPGSALSNALSIASLINGPILGVFLVGTFLRRVSQPPALIGMVVSIGSMLYVFLATKIAWPWYVLLGSLITFLVAWAASFAFAPSAKEIGPIGPIGPIPEEGLIILHKLNRYFSAILILILPVRLPVTPQDTHRCAPFKREPSSKGAEVGQRCAAQDVARRERWANSSPLASMRLFSTRIPTLSRAQAPDRSQQSRRHHPLPRLGL